METSFKILGLNVLTSSKYGGFSKIFNLIIIGFDNSVLSLRVRQRRTESAKADGALK